jgi:hypothetical protein
MCKFFSCLVTQQADILWHEATDSHEDLVAHFGLNDTRIGPFVRVEFTPPQAIDVGDIDKYVLKADEVITPEWFEPMRESVTERISSLVRPMIISDERKFVLGGVWVLRGNANVHSLKNGRIIAMCGSSQVGVMYGSSQVGVMRDSSQVREMYDSSQVGVMYDSSQVCEMHESSQVREMYSSSQVGVMYGFSQVREMYGSSQIGVMYGSSQVGVMRDSSQVREMYSSSQIGVMYGSSRITLDYRKKK